MNPIGRQSGRDGVSRDDRIDGSLVGALSNPRFQLFVRAFDHSAAAALAPRVPDDEVRLGYLYMLKGAALVEMGRRHRRAIRMGRRRWISRQAKRPFGSAHGPCGPAALVARRSSRLIAWVASFGGARGRVGSRRRCFAPKRMRRRPWRRAALRRMGW
jgi:hypothetical protein